MKKVFQYRLPVHDGPITGIMPRTATILHVGQQGDPNSVCVWALVDINEPTMIEKTFLIVGTGQSIDDPARWTHLATVSYHPAPQVWHVFQEKIQ